MTMRVRVPRALALVIAATGAGWLLAAAGASQAAAPPSLESVVTATIAFAGAAACLGIGAITALGTVESLVTRRPSRVHAALPQGLRRLITGTVAATVLAGAALPAHAQEVYPGWVAPSPSPTLTSRAPSPSPSPEVEITATVAPSAPEAPQPPAQAAPPAAPAAPVRDPQPQLELHAESSAPAPRSEAASLSAKGVHVVVRGDSLWRITANLLGPSASNAAIADAWPLIYQANREVIGDDPGLILPGQRLTIPAEVAA